MSPPAAEVTASSTLAEPTPWRAVVRSSLLLVVGFASAMLGVCLVTAVEWWLAGW